MFKSIQNLTKYYSSSFNLALNAFIAARNEPGMGRITD